MKEVKKDCFAYDKDRNKCHVLKRLYCETEITGKDAADGAAQDAAEGVLMYGA